MKYKQINVPESKTIALVAHDNKKDSLLEWCHRHEEILKCHNFYATGTTGYLIAEQTSLEVKSLVSGPLGGDQQIGALITEGEIDMLIFYWDPLAAQPHDPDVKALLRLAAVWNVPVACNESTADMLISSTLFNNAHKRSSPDYESYLQQRLNQ